MSAPPWLDPLLVATTTVRADAFSRVLLPADGSGRLSAVLILVSGATLDHADVLLLTRAATLRSHAGQVAFPGGATDLGDASAAATALREAREEVGLLAESVTVLAQLPELYIPPSRFRVTPVLAFWQEPHPVGPVDQGEVEAVMRVSLLSLADPANRFTVRAPSGWTGPGFEVDGLFVWGFTAGLIAGLLRLGGWERSWDHGVERAFAP